MAKFMRMYMFVFFYIIIKENIVNGDGHKAVYVSILTISLLNP